VTSNVRNMKLTTVDDLFSSEESRQAEKQQQGEQVLTVPISDVHDFANNPYRVRQDAELMEMAESIERIGVHTPCLARPRPDGGYELLSGHRRKLASTLAGCDTLPLIVREVDDDAATILVVDGNIQRETITFSEKAQAYKMKLEALTRQGKRTDLTCAQLGHKSDGKKSRDIVAEQAGESKSQIQRYIRLTALNPELLQMVDDRQIAFNPAVELSYLNETEQQDLLTTMESEDCTPSLSQAQRMKKLSQGGRLNTDVIFSILTEEKPNQRDKLTIKAERIERFFPKNYTEKQKEDVIVQLLEGWYRKRQREQQR
jgi:ParB family chromosome partitioning protein